MDVDDIINWIMHKTEEADIDNAEIDDFSLEYDDESGNSCLVISLTTDFGEDMRFRVSVNRIE